MLRYVDTVTETDCLVECLRLKRHTGGHVSYVCISVYVYVSPGKRDTV
jgi:hypothetical protein